MSDIFISYSRKDSEQAQALAQMLTSAGLSVWIDHQSIEAATRWSGEITKAINDCRAFVVLLSPYSIASHNVSKEVSLASERKKKIFPLDLEPVELPNDMAYHLAGIQRSSMSNIDSVIRALGKLGLEATGTPALELVKLALDGRKCVMVLPFEDLSPTHDNDWFTDGIVTELISALSNVKALRLSDAQATKEFKNYQGQLTTYASAMQIRYFVQGSVRKFGDQIKITAQLLDIDTGDCLWQHSLKGVMDNIFDIQEEVARDVLQGLEVHLTSGENTRLSRRGTENVEAYELYLRAAEYHERGGLANDEHAAKLAGMALEVDPHFALAKLRRAILLTSIYIKGRPELPLLEEAEQLAVSAGRTVSAKEDWRVLGTQSKLARIRGDLETDELLVRENYALDPGDDERIAEMAALHLRKGELEESIRYYEIRFGLFPSYSNAHRLFNASVEFHDTALRGKCAAIYLPLANAHLKVHPGDEDALQWTLAALLYLDRRDEASRYLRSLSDEVFQRPFYLYNIACLSAQLGELDRAMSWLTRYVRLTDEPHAEVIHGLLHRELDPLREREEFREMTTQLMMARG